jgi:hypothetical protein
MSDRRHVHSEKCAGPPTCVREWDLDERSQTGAYRIVTRKGYGARAAHDKPRWWPIAYHGFKTLITVVGILLANYIAKKLGLTNLVGMP